MKRHIVFAFLCSLNFLAVSHCSQKTHTTNTVYAQPQTPQWQWSNWYNEFSLSSVSAKKCTTLQVELIKAISKNNIELVKEILSILKTYYKNPAHFYISHTQAERLAGIVEGAHASVTPLLLAQNAEMAELLISYGADVNSCSYDGEFPADKVTGQVLSIDKFSKAQELFKLFEVLKSKENWWKKTVNSVFYSQGNPFVRATIFCSQVGVIVTSAALTNLLKLKIEALANNSDLCLVVTRTTALIGSLALWSYLIKNSKCAYENETLEQEQLFGEHLTKLQR